MRIQYLVDLLSKRGMQHLICISKTKIYKIGWVVIEKNANANVNTNSFQYRNIAFRLAPPISGLSCLLLKLHRLQSSFVRLSVRLFRPHQQMEEKLWQFQPLSDWVDDWLARIATTPAIVMELLSRCWSVGKSLSTTAWWFRCQHRPVPHLLPLPLSPNCHPPHATVTQFSIWGNNFTAIYAIRGLSRLKRVRWLCCFHIYYQIWLFGTGWMPTLRLVHTSVGLKNFLLTKKKVLRLHKPEEPTNCGIKTADSQDNFFSRQT